MEEVGSVVPASEDKVVRKDQTSAEKAGFPINAILKALEKVPDPDAKTTLQLALSRTTLGVGPDPETAKIIADSEKHAEDCKLVAYRASLSNRDKQGERDHDFRKRRLNREFTMNLTVLLLGLAGAATGFYFISSGNTTVGSNVLIASIGVILYVLKGSSELLKP